MLDTKQDTEGRRVGIGFRWEPDEDAFLCEHYSEMHVEDIAKHLERTPQAVKSRAAKLGQSSPAGGHPWRLEEDDFLRANYKTMTQDQISKELGRTVSSVGSRASLLGLQCRRPTVDFVCMPRFNLVTDLMMSCAKLDGGCSSCRLRVDCFKTFRRHMMRAEELYEDLTEERFTRAIDDFATLFSRRAAIIGKAQEEESLRARIRAAEGLTIYRCED